MWTVKAKLVGGADVEISCFERKAAKELIAALKEMQEVSDIELVKAVVMDVKPDPEDLNRWIGNMDDF
jgi:hypothetical protein